MKGHKTSITFYQEAWHHACLVFMLTVLKKTTALRHLSKNVIDYIIRANTPEQSCIITRSYAASFSIEA